VSGGGADRIGEQLGGELGQRRLDQLRAILRLRGVEPEHDVKVQHPRTWHSATLT
jgi:hypothetical protein